MAINTGGYAGWRLPALWLLDQIRINVGGAPAPGARTTTERSTDYTASSGFTQVVVTWLGGGSGVLEVDGIPYDASKAGQVAFDTGDSGSDVDVVANGNTYYTTES